MPGPSATGLADFRRQLHAHPELSEREVQTATRVAERLAGCGPSRLLTGLGQMQTGVCAAFDSGEAGPGVLLRCELDALPIQETNTFRHRSRVAGVAHACGHDGHMATLLGVAEDLAQKMICRGRVYLLFQPAEETGTGARAILDDPQFLQLAAPDYVYACHNVPKYPLGKVLLRRGIFSQASVGFFVEFTGTTSHASYPEHGINPSGAVTSMVMRVNQLDMFMKKRVSAPVLGTVTLARIGNNGNTMNFGVAPGEGSVTGVVRAQSDEDLAMVRDGIADLAHQLAQTHGLGHRISWHEAFAATLSDNECNAVIERAADFCGLQSEELAEPFRWSEDFGYFTGRFKGAFFGLGAGTGQPQLHDDSYDFPDELITVGVGLYRAIIDQHLGSGQAT